MEFIKKNQNFIFAALGVLIAICGIAMAVVAVLENQKAKTLTEEAPVLAEGEDPAT